MGTLPGTIFGSVTFAAPRAACVTCCVADARNKREQQANH
jgi:hypothetical protein